MNAISRPSDDDQPTAHRLQFTGSGPYAKSFEGTGFGVVFEDNGETGYFYATNEDNDEVFDALCLYNVGDPGQLKPGEEAFIVWSPRLQKVGMYYHDEFHAVIDFKNRLACCRTGFPPPGHTQWCRSAHRWEDSLVKGLEPRE